MGVTVDVTFKSLNKYSEILCGDTVCLLYTSRMAELLGKGLEQMGELAEAEGTSTDSHALQEAENEK